MANIEATTFTLVGGAFKMGNGASPEVFTALNQVTDVDLNGSKWDAPDVTSADNSDGVRRYTRTLKDPGKVTVTFWFNPNDSTHQQLRAMFQSASAVLTPTNFQFVRPGTLGMESFAACLESLDYGKISVDKPTAATAKFQISGEVTYSILA